MIPDRPSARRRRWLLAAGAGLLVPLVGRAQDDSARNRKLFLASDAERDARVLAAARKEGEVSIYTSLNTRDSQPLLDAFEKKTGVKARLWRGSSEKVVQRSVTESNAGRHTCDVVETDGPEMEALYREKLLAEFWSPSFKELPAAAFPKHRQYVADRFNFFVLGYNTKLVKPDEVPKSYEDLLQPRFVGKVALEAGDSDWFAAMVGALGDEKGMAYFRQLAAAKPQMRSGHTLLAELLSSGEVAIAANIYNHNIARMSARGAPVAWRALSPTFARPNAVALMSRAPHPNAALLLADFMLSNQGQTILRDHDRVPVNLTVDTPLNKFPFQTISPELSLDQSGKWEDRWSELFLGGKKVQKEEG